MTGEEWALVASSFFSGLAAGFLGGLCMIVRPMQAAMDGVELLHAERGPQGAGSRR